MPIFSRIWPFFVLFLLILDYFSHDKQGLKIQERPLLEWRHERNCWKIEGHAQLIETLRFVVRFSNLVWCPIPWRICVFPVHYDSLAFSKNGFETMVAKAPEMTAVIGAAIDFSPVCWNFFWNFRFDNRCHINFRFHSEVFRNFWNWNLKKKIILSGNFRNISFLKNYQPFNEI